MRTNPDYCFGLPGGLWREPHILAAPNIEPNGHSRNGQSLPPHRLKRGRYLSGACCPIELGGTWLQFWGPTGPSPSAPMSLPRGLHEHLDHDAELQRYRHRHYEQLG